MILSVTATVGIIITVCSNAYGNVLQEKYTTHKIHTKLHPGPEWCIFHIRTSELRY